MDAHRIATLHTVDNPVDAQRTRWVSHLGSGIARSGRSSWALARLTVLAGALALISGYQRWISPGLAPRCRFYPSCSTYAVQALRAHGIGRGGALAARRLLRCHPWNPGGIDPVPLPLATRAPGHPAPVAVSPSNSPGA